MISKKMRNISMVCLSLVLALTLAFGLSSFSSIKKADAAESLNDAQTIDFKTQGDVAIASTNGAITVVYSNYKFYASTSKADDVKINSSGLAIKKGSVAFKISQASIISITFSNGGGRNYKFGKDAVAETDDYTSNTYSTFEGTPTSFTVTKGTQTFTVMDPGIYKLYTDNTNSNVITSIEITQMPEDYFIDTENNSLADISFNSSSYNVAKGATVTRDNITFYVDSSCGNSNGFNYSSSTLKIYASTAISFYLKKPASVTFTSKNGVAGILGLDTVGKNGTYSSSNMNTFVGNTKNLTKADTKGTKQFVLDGGRHKIYFSEDCDLLSIEVEYLDFDSFPSTGYEYEFIGYNVDGVMANEGTGEQAIFAKAEYLGASFKTTGASIRYGFILEIVNANGEALSDEVLATLKSSVSDGKFTFTTSQENIINVVNLGSGTVTSNGEQKSGIVANLVITEMEETHYTAETTTSISLTINGIEFTANSGAAASAQEKAQAAFNNDLISTDIAASFGVTSKTNTDANE